jgi:hypothetical protein
MAMPKLMPSAPRPSDKDASTNDRADRMADVMTRMSRKMRAAGTTPEGIERNIRFVRQTDATSR